jgi:hypothetical protein
LNYGRDLRFESDPEALAAAARVGFDAIQVTLSKPDAQGKLLLADYPLQQRILRSSVAHKVAIVSTLRFACLDAPPWHGSLIRYSAFGSLWAAARKQGEYSCSTAP